MPTFNIFEVIGIVFFCQAGLHIVFLLGSPSSNSQRRLTWLLAVLLILLVNLFIRNRFNNSFPYFYFEYISLLAPIQFLYTQSLIKRENNESVGIFAHLAGFYVVITARIIYFLIFQDDFPESVFEQFVSIPVFAYCFFYLYLSINSISNFHEIIKLTRSNFDLYNLKWLRFELLLLGLFFFTAGIESLELFINLGDWYLLIIAVSFLTILLFINILTFKNLKAPYHPDRVTNEEVGVYSANQIKYQRSNISPDLSRQHFEQLNNLIVEKKPFKEYRLSLAQLSQMIDLTPAQLSQVINENSEMNFNDFINKYRVEEAKELFENNPDWLIKEIMYESGFQSTSTFNNVFKKFTKLSPSAFQNRLK